jgi:hypothetical protein
MLAAASPTHTEAARSWGNLYAPSAFTGRPDHGADPAAPGRCRESRRARHRSEGAVFLPVDEDLLWEMAQLSHLSGVSTRTFLP